MKSKINSTNTYAYVDSERTTGRYLTVLLVKKSEMARCSDLLTWIRILPGHPEHYGHSGELRGATTFVAFQREGSLDDVGKVVCGQRRR